MTLFGKSYCPVCGLRVLARSGKCIYVDNDDHFGVAHDHARPTYCAICGQRLGRYTGRCWNEHDRRHRPAGGRPTKAPPRVCPTCLGRGVILNSLRRCSACGGTGWAGW
jgi:hypothetical protein